MSEKDTLQTEGEKQGLRASERERERQASKGQTTQTTPLTM
jgi:hypothetical protein